MERVVRDGPLADVRTPLLYEHWYVAGLADEFADGLHERTFLNRSIVIYRAADGELVGLQNRCTHRSFPLSHGWREGDEIRCRYHGARYDRTGALVDFPPVAQCPRHLSVRRYPMRISGPLAWIWMGDPEAEGPLPQTPWLEAGWTYATGSYTLDGNWLLMAENLMDLTHIPFLHQTTFNFPRSFAQAPVTLEVAGDRLLFYRENPPNYHRTGFMRPAVSDAIERAGFRSRSEVEFVSPALTFGGGRFVLEQPRPEEPSGYAWQVAHFTTPVTEKKTLYWYFFSRNYLLDDAALTEAIRATIVAGFDEDREAVELLQRMHDEDRHPYREAHFRSDAPAVAMRRIVAAMARREQARAAAETPADRQVAAV